MKIAFDIRPFLSGETGVGVYYRNLLENLALIDKDNTYLLFSSSLKQRFPASELPSFSKYMFRDLRIPVKFLNYCWYKLGFPGIQTFFGRKAELTHSPSPVIIPSSGRSIITVHDLCFLDRPDLVMEEAVDLFATNLYHNLKKADGIIAVSEATRNSILDHYGMDFNNKIRVIHHGTDMASVEAEAPDIKLPERFILTVGTIEPRKDLGTLIKAFADISDGLKDIHLVIAGGKGWKQSQLADLPAELNIEDRVHFTGYMSRSNLKYLYSRAELYVFPSLYEGFGLPLLEAASEGIPAIASDLKVFREIFEDYPSYFRTGDPSDLASKLREMLADKKAAENSAEKSRHISARYCWKQTAEKTLEFYREVLK